MSLAVGAVICATLVQTIPLGFLLLFCAYAIGAVPDLDLKLPGKHRGKASHSLIGIYVIIVILLGIALFYVLAIIDQLYLIFGAVLINWFPAFFVKLFSGDFAGAFTDPFFIIILTFYSAYVMHLILDTVTRSGIKWFGRSVKGNIQSSNTSTNKGFILFGSLATVISLPFFIVRVLWTTSIYPYYAYFLVTFFASLAIIVFGAVRIRKDQDSDRCIKIGESLVCLRKKCIDVDGKVYCPTNSTDE